jgi:hypothetical protein
MSPGYYSPILDRVAAECLAALRRAPGMTCPELAALLGRPHATVWNSLSGKSAIYGDAFSRGEKDGRAWRWYVRQVGA